MASEFTVVIDAERVDDDGENMAECSHGMGEIGSQSHLLSSRNDCRTDKNQPDSRRDYCVAKRQIKTAGNPRSRSEERENVIHRCSETVAIRSVKQRLPSRICKDFELDMLLTPTSHNVNMSRLQEVNVTECSSRDEIGSKSHQPSSKNDCTDTNQPDSRRDYCVVKRQRKTACSPSSRSKECENTIHLCSKTATKSMKQSRIYRDFELDVLLTPLSESRVNRILHPGASVSSFPSDSAPSPENSHLMPTAATSESHASVLPRVSETGKQSSDRDADVIENCVPKSVEASGNCSLIPLQFLSLNNAFVSDDTEVDVFVRSFWDEQSDADTPGFNQVVNFADREDSADSRIRGAVMKKGAARKQKRHVPDSTGTKQKMHVPASTKQKENVSAGTKKQKKKVAASTVATKNSRQRQSKAESSRRKSSSSSQKSTRTEYVVLKYCGMTLRPRKIVEVKASQKYRDSPMKPPTKKRKRNEKAVVGKSNKPCEQRVARDSAAVRCSSRLGAKRPSSDQQMPRGAATKPPKTTRSTSSRKSHSGKQPAKKCVTGQRENRAGKVNPAHRKENIETAATKPKTTRSTSSKKSRSGKQPAEKCVTGERENGTGKINPAHGKENIKTAATKPLQSCEVKSVGATGKAKKSRSVSVLSLYIVPGGPKKTGPLYIFPNI